MLIVDQARWSRDRTGRRAGPLADLAVDAEVGRWNRWLRYPEGRINALHAAAPLIAGMPPGQVARQVARLAGHLGLDHPIVTGAVTGALTGVIATGQGSISHHPAAPGPDRQDQPPPVIRAARRDSPHTAQQAAGQAATTADPHRRPGSAGRAQAGLRTGHRPG